MQLTKPCTKQWLSSYQHAHIVEACFRLHSEAL